MIYFSTRKRPGGGARVQGGYLPINIVNLKEGPTCQEVESKTSSVECALNRLEGFGIRLPVPVVGLTLHLAWCDRCQKENKTLAKRARKQVKRCLHQNFAVGQVCVHFD